VSPQLSAKQHETTRTQILPLYATSCDICLLCIWHTKLSNQISLEKVPPLVPSIPDTENAPQWSPLMTYELAPFFWGCKRHPAARPDSLVWTHPQPRPFPAFIGRYHKRRPARGFVSRFKAEGFLLDSASALLFHQKVVVCGHSLVVTLWAWNIFERTWSTRLDW